MIEFDVKMTTAKLYDYMLRHTMTSFQGILAVALGLFLVVGFFTTMNWKFLAAGIVLILYTPITLYFSARRQMQKNPVFANVLHYRLSEDGITIEVNEESDHQSWQDMYRAVSTLRSVILYTNKINACIFPKEDMGSQKDEVIKMICTHMDPSRVSIRG